jgi:hypothetical protein
MGIVKTQNTLSMFIMPRQRIVDSVRHLGEGFRLRASMLDPIATILNYHFPVQIQQEFRRILGDRPSSIIEVKSDLRETQRGVFLVAMIDYKSDHGSRSQLGQKSSAVYAPNNAWPHLVIDDFFDPEWLEHVRVEVSARLRLDHILKALVQDLTPPIFRKTIRALKRRHRGDKMVEV